VFTLVSLHLGSARNLDVGAAALEGGSFLVYVGTSGSGAGRCHGREGDVVFDEQCVVVVAQGSSWRLPMLEIVH
jgi:hypothetical protein